MKYKKNKLYIISIVLLLLLIPSIFIGSKLTSANAQRVIRVGYYPLENYHNEDAAGNIVGYEVEYLNRIAELTNWKYEFIETDSWSSAIDMLRNKEIDLLSPVQILEERVKEFNFSASPIGKVYGAIMTLNTNDFVYEDFKKFSDMKFGIEMGVSYNKLFEQYASENNFYPNIKIYKNHNTLVEALNVGKVDAIVANIMRTEEDMKLLGKFGSSSYYFMCRKEDTWLKKKLDDALYEIDMVTPNFEQSLVNKYFPIYNVEPLTKAEVEYVKQTREFVIGCPITMTPVSYMDDETGEVAGITRRILEKVAEGSGLKFRFQALPLGQISYDDLRESGVDFVSCVEYNSINANSSGIQLSVPYFEAQKVLIGVSGKEFYNEDHLKVAIAAGSKTITKLIQSEYPHFEVKLYNSVRDCMDAVCSGEVDVILQNQYEVDVWLSKPKYEKLAIIQTEGISDSHCLSPMIYKDEQGRLNKELSNPMLLSIINKAINNLSEKEVSTIIVNETTKNYYQFTIEDFIYRYRYFLAILSALIVLLIIITIYARKVKQKNMELLISSEKRLRNITNNINGGVLILLPDKGLQLVYANEGFWNLIQHDRKEFDNLHEIDYIMYVHKKDISILNELVRTNYNNEKQISIRLRILRKDGSYIPVMFNGTMAENEEGKKEMYCVIMDISKEVSMLEQLQLEKKKHTLLIEKSDEIIYEIDFKKGNIDISDSFRERFGWTFTKSNFSINKQNLLAIWRIWEEDRDNLLEFFTKSIDDLEDSQCVVRIMKTNGKYRWCRINQFVMLNKKGELGLLLGKIVDIHNEMREREKLKEQSQKDSLTGLYNKEAFKQLCTEYLNKNQEQDCAVIFLDLDNFKSVNDVLGHMIGDKAIIDAAQKLKTVFSSYDFIGRFGGDEFCVLVKNITKEALENKMQWLVGMLKHTYKEGEEEVSITASVGVAYTRLSGYDFRKLLEYADTALYEVKENGKNQYIIYNEQ